ncbi:ATP-dependent RecD-like DNA helicase [Acutalibacter sp. JLR.KK004]|uniref:SF1B family DNA helicase RecD2 n=1 Tax=Acutalibacter sp. JLR.KK004 TaxID=3112622 RepID=UPI002FEFF5ED
MLCEFERLIYPSSPDPSSYMVAMYRPCEKIRDMAGNTLDRVKAVGYCLPTASDLRFDIQGQWSRSAKHGLQFEVDRYEEVLVPTKEGVIAYLSSGQIKGIGPKMAERIYDAFGLKALDVLDKEPQRLLEIKGISESKLKTIQESYLVNRGARDVVAFLAPHGVSPRLAVKLYQEYKEQTMDIVKNHPYRLCELAGIGFKTADAIGGSMGIDPLSTERVDQALLYTLSDAEGCGHLCMEKRAFISACEKLLDTPKLTFMMIANRAARLVENGQLVTFGPNVYRTKAAHAEQKLANRIKQLLRIPVSGCLKLDAELDNAERRFGVNFAPEQRTAVKMALTQSLSIITGGPGTGKTMIQRAILDIYKRQHPDHKICCCAPTGRAARRMEQSTGHPANTVHKTLNLLANEDGDYGQPEPIDADLILVDEVSMLDIYLANYLLQSVSLGSQLVLIGDADQLPSVGPGAVLSEMIASEQVPVARLDKVFRQEEGSRIAANAKLIRDGYKTLEWGDDFSLVESPTIQESADKIVELYMREVEKHGLDNVALLTPYRKKTATGADSLNARLRDLVNPPDPEKREAHCGKRVFRVGDKVMQTKNSEEVNNGDVGYITRISYGEDTTVQVDFGGLTVNYSTESLSKLDWGYASTVHKSQGSEYQSVLINLQKAHYIMLNRPLIYTAITRGKSKVTLVGERRALYTAISKTETEKRGTCLAQRLQQNS